MAHDPGVAVSATRQRVVIAAAAPRRVVVTDSALGKSGRGYLCQWLQSDFEKVWMRTKGGVAMVICPPAGAVVRAVTNLPPFPKDRTFPVGDDH